MTVGEVTRFHSSWVHLGQNKSVCGKTIEECKGEYLELHESIVHFLDREEVLFLTGTVVDTVPDARDVQVVQHAGDGLQIDRAALGQKGRTDVGREYLPEDG